MRRRNSLTEEKIRLLGRHLVLYHKPGQGRIRQSLTTKEEKGGGLGERPTEITYRNMGKLKVDGDALRPSIRHARERRLQVGGVERKEAE